MPYNEKPIIGAQIMPSHHLPKPNYPAVVMEKPSMESLDSAYVYSGQQPMSTREYDPTSTNPSSPFYAHPTTRTSFEQQKSESRTDIRIYEHDLESGSQVVVPMKKETANWPANIHKKDLCCQKRSLNPMKSLSRKQKLWTKVVIALIIVGAAVGLGIGIS